MTTPAPVPFVFNYTKYNAPALTVAQLDTLAMAVFRPDGLVGYAVIVWSGVKLILAMAYIFVRAKLIDQEMQIEKQQYEVSQTAGNQGEVNGQEPVPPVAPS